MCADRSLRAFLCGVYDAWMSRKGHANVRLEIQGTNQDMELFAEYADVEPSQEKAGKVLEAMRTKLSREVFRQVYAASLSWGTGARGCSLPLLIQASRLGACCDGPSAGTGGL